MIWQRLIPYVVSAVLGLAGSGLVAVNMPGSVHEDGRERPGVAPAPIAPSAAPSAPIAAPTSAPVAEPEPLWPPVAAVPRFVPASPACVCPAPADAPPQQVAPEPPARRRRSELPFPFVLLEPLFAAFDQTQLSEEN